MDKITFVDGKLVVPDYPIIPFIEGDGIGKDVMAAARKVIDAAVAKAYGGEKEIHWTELLAGEKAAAEGKEHLPKETLEALKDHVISIKGPLTTPVGSGIRSLNVSIRQELDLFACVRPVRWFEGVPSPMKEPQKLNVVIFRENTEDVYAGIEWEEGSDEAKKVIRFLNEDLHTSIRADSGIGIKPISVTGTKRLVRAAINHALRYGFRTVTLVHKGNIMKFTEGAFKSWGYDVSKEFEDVVQEGFEGKVVMNDRIADSMFQQILLRPDEYGVIATSNLNGDYLSDACAAQVGGIGIAPGANINYETGTAVFEATHGSAPKYAGQDKVNPGSVILSGVMMLQYMGWDEAADMIVHAFEKTIKEKKVTYDFHRLMDNATLLKTSEFAQAVIGNL